jgi:hypothetical protein
MTPEMKWWQRLRVFRNLAALAGAFGALSLRVAALEAQMNGKDAEHIGVEGIVIRLGRCDRCGVVHLAGNGLTKVSANVDGEVRPVSVCGTCKHLVKVTGRGR